MYSRITEPILIKFDTDVLELRKGHRLSFIAKKTVLK